MATTKVTFTLDQATISRLQEAATRMTMPKSEVVRAAIAEFYERIGRLSESERLRMLRGFDELVPRIPVRSAAEVDREIGSIRQSRNAGGRRHTT
jgi:hypothetical protein